jgi:hypothetical protein
VGRARVLVVVPVCVLRTARPSYPTITRDFLLAHTSHYCGRWSQYSCSGSNGFCYPYLCQDSSGNTICSTSPCSVSECSRGEYLSSGSCYECDRGQYQSSTQHTYRSCDWCPSGRTSNVGSSSCYSTPAPSPSPSPSYDAGGCSTLGGHDSDALLGGRVEASIPGVGSCFFDNQSDLENALRRAGEDLEDAVCDYLSQVGCLAHPECCGPLETCEQPEVDTGSFGEMLTTGAQSMLGTCELSIAKLFGFVIVPILVICGVVVCCCMKKSTKAKDPQVALPAATTTPAPAFAPPPAIATTKTMPLVPTNPVSTSHVAIAIAEPSPASPAAFGSGTNLQAELSLLKMPELRKRAQEAGISEDAVEVRILSDADSDRPRSVPHARSLEDQLIAVPAADTTTRQEARDQDEPKQAVIALIVNAGQSKVEAAAREAATLRAVKAELQQLKMPDLRKRAAVAGASAEAIEDARDGDDPKADMIELILAHQSSQP